ncbi:MAG: GDP-mannose 4,6-dehydratase [Clostridia bacterium]|nr:GDP-mannose 4,6-dehydratase [Clostridia bacterium]
MKKALITGSEGFVGKYLRYELEQNGYEVTGIDLVSGLKVLTIDLLDPEQVWQVIKTEQPDYIFHLAGQANVGISWQIPQKTMEINVNAALNLMEAIRRCCPDTKLLLVGSSDQYGNLRGLDSCINEDIPMNPMNPYAVSKMTQELMGKAYANAYNLKICMTRSFNHGGAGQKPGFMIPDFASGIVKVERGEQDCLHVGNLASRRDFTHVKDVVRAYRLIAEKGKTGEAYNVGSGTAYSAQEVLDKLIALSTSSIIIKQDPDRMRPSDTPVICCNHQKLTEDTGWEPERNLNEILADTLTYYRNQR